MGRLLRRRPRSPWQGPGTLLAHEAPGASQGEPGRVPGHRFDPVRQHHPASQEPWFPGDEETERRIRAYIRWNAAIMVVRANHIADGIGGHLATFASSASLYEVGFNHFFRGKADGQTG